MELLNYLEFASHINEVKDGSILENLVHFLFDDHDLAGHIDNVGSIFLNSEECIGVAKFSSALDEAIGESDLLIPSISSEKWLPIKRLASEAHRMLSSAGEPIFE